MAPRKASAQPELTMELQYMTTDIDPALTGAAFDLANAGYKAMRDPHDKGDRETIDSDSASLRRAAEQRSPASGTVKVRRYADTDGKPMPANESVSLDRAARDYAGMVSTDKLKDESKSSKDLAATVDALRAEALARDPDASDRYGFGQPETDVAKVEQTDGAGQTNETPSEGTDLQLEKILQHPQVMQAIGERVGEAEKARQEYRDGLAAATRIARESFMGYFPELAAIPPEDLPAALQLMSRQDPAKYTRVKAMIDSSEQLLTQHAQQARHQAEMARQDFARFARSEDARLETMLKDEPKAIQQAVMTEIRTSARESGIEPAELTRLFATEPLMRNAIFQRMMYDAAKYRLMMKARDAAIAKPLPPVQRPGIAATRSERERGDIRTLNSKLSASGDIRDAVALYQARKSVGR
jgi:hypothetical protein